MPAGPSLFSRYDALNRASSLEDWRLLSLDLLAELVTAQGVVIELQRRALDTRIAGSPKAATLRTSAQAAFADVQRLNELRRKVHAMLAEKRASSRKFVLLPQLEAAA